MVISTTVSHPFLSPIVTVYVPAERPAAEDPTETAGFQTYVYAGVPPLGEKLILPFFEPLQVIFFTVGVGFIAAGLVIVFEIFVTHPFLSVTVHI